MNISGRGGCPSSKGIGQFLSFFDLDPPLSASFVSIVCISLMLAVCGSPPRKVTVNDQDETGARWRAQIKMLEPILYPYT